MTILTSNVVIVKSASFQLNKWERINITLSRAKLYDRVRISFITCSCAVNNIFPMGKHFNKKTLCFILKRINDTTLNILNDNYFSRNPHFHLATNSSHFDEILFRVLLLKDPLSRLKYYIQHITFVLNYI